MACDVGESVRFTTLDLFAGAGGLTQGFKEADSRFCVARAVEWDPAAAATYQANHGDHGTGDLVYAGGIEDWLETDDVPRVDVVLGGPPCQGFSALGRRDINDERNFLWRKYAQTIFRAQPRYFVMENVPQFLTSPELALFIQETKDGMLEGYGLQLGVLNAADFGAPQVRKRGLVIGSRNDVRPMPWPEPTHSRDSWVSVRQALRYVRRQVRNSGLPPARGYVFNGQRLPGPWTSRQLHVTRSYTPLSLQRFGHIPEGGNRHHLPDELSSPCWRNHPSGASDVMGRLRWNRPSVTIRTEFFKPEKGRYLHPQEHRAITHFEATRLQGFPDDYRWVGTKTDIARQIGNAVPIALGAALGRAAASVLSASRTEAVGVPSASAGRDEAREQAPMGSQRDAEFAFAGSPKAI